MIPYQTHKNKLPGTNYKEVYKVAWDIYRNLSRLTKRQPYIRSAYFNKEKVFFTYFWKHLFQYSHNIRTQRLKYFSASIELIKNSRNNPASHENPNNKEEILHRFAGQTKDKNLFFVQIKQNKRSGKKHLMSIFGPG